MALNPGRRPPRRLITVGLALLATLVVLLAAGRALLDSHLVRTLPQTTHGLVVGGFLLVSAILAMLATRALMAAVFGRAAGTALATWRTAASWAVYIVLGLVIVSQLQVDLSGFLVGSAVIGVVLGVGAQTSLANLFAGAILLLSRPFSVGGWVHLRTYLFGGFGGSDFSGLVVHIGSFHTVLDVGGRPVHIPNSAMLTAAITTSPIPVQVDLDVTLPAAAPLAAIEGRIADGLGLRPPASVALLPQRVSLGGDPEVSCRLQVAALRSVDVRTVVRLLAEAAGAAPTEAGRRADATRPPGPE